MSSSIDVKRKSGIELLRIISMILIVLYHFVCFRFKDMGSLDIFSFNNFLLSFFWAGGKYGVILFGIITGYFMIKSKVCLKKIVKLEFQVLFYSVSIMFLFFILGKKELSSDTLSTYFFPNYNRLYWFFSSYFLLYLFIPIFNFILLRLRKGYFLVLLGILFGVFIFIPSFNLMVNLNDGIYLFFYYIVGAYIRLFMDELENKKVFLSLGVLFYFLIIISTFVIQYLSNFNEILLGYVYSFTKLGSVLSFTSAIFLFMFFKDLNLKNSGWINRVSGVCFGVYLFHEHNYMREFLWFELFDVNLFLGSPYFIFYAMFVVGVIFIVGGIFEMIRCLIGKSFHYLYLDFKEFLSS